METHPTTTALTAGIPRRLNQAEQREIDAALARLARGHGVLVRAAGLLTNGVGSAASLGLRQLKIPRQLERQMSGLALALLTRAYDVSTIGLNRPSTPTDHRRLVAGVIASGAVGGAAGFAGFIPDASLTTLAILRAIASEALRQGESLTNEATREACLQVFLLPDLAGKPTGYQPTGLLSDQIEHETVFAYHTSRLILRGRPLALLLSEAAAHYGLKLSQKFVAQSIPIIGAAAGASLNSAFLQHYRDLARAFFTIRRVNRSTEIEP